VQRHHVTAAYAHDIGTFRHISYVATGVSGSRKGREADR
jgi:hypothetical protein